MQVYNTLYVKLVKRPKSSVLRMLVHTHDAPTSTDALYVRELALPATLAQVQAKAEEFQLLTRTARIQLIASTSIFKQLAPQ
jgi:hypothetical protein